MGIVNGTENRSAMEALFLFLAEEFKIENFVETGTYQGDTSRFASDHFARVFTIEGAEPLFHAARERLADRANIECLHGDSRHHLAELCSRLSGPSLFWLDAHWSGGETFGEKAECPLLAELAAIYERVPDPFTIIDDARFFISVPPEPHDISAWPDYFEIAEAVWKRRPSTYVTLYADSVVLVPRQFSDRVIPFLRRPISTRSDRRNRWLRWSRSA